ncbi:MAG: CHAT domain-containing tetratricopeptide repeat protein [Saprospiraceae bacterium]
MVKKRELDQAIIYNDSAYSIGLKVSNENQLNLVFTNSVYGNIHEIKGEFSEAFNYYSKNVKIIQASLGNNHPYLGIVFLELCRASYKDYDLKTSRIYLEKANEIISANENHGWSQLKRDYLITAVDYFRHAAEAQKNTIKNLDSLSRAVENYLENISFTNNSKQETEPLYHQLEYLSIIEKSMQVLMDKAYVKDITPELLYFSEKFKANTLSENLSRTYAEKFAGIPDSLLNKEYQLNIDIAYYEKKKFNEQYESVSPHDSLISIYKNKIFDLKRELEKLVEKFKSGYPDYHRLKYDFTVTKVQDIQSDLTSSQALIEYFTGDSSIFIFTITPTDYQVQEVKKDFPLEGWVSKMREGIYNYWISPNQPLDSYNEGNKKYAEAAYLLYQKLIAPIKIILPEELIIVPDGVLGYLPFDILLKEKPLAPENFKSYQYLIKNHQISYAYSATLWQEMKDKIHEAPKVFFAVAPSFEGEPIASRSVIDIRQSLGELKYNIPEVRAISSLVKGGDSITGKQATVAAFLERAGQYKILHLSTHGKADDRVGDYSFLAFAKSTDSLDNGKLYIRDLYNMHLNAEMVVLSACETGIGELQRGEGILSLARGFAYAGAKSIVNTLWSVNDKSTGEIMQYFYKHLKDGKSKDAALRFAKLDYLKNTNQPDPFSGPPCVRWRYVPH